MTTDVRIGARWSMGAAFLAGASILATLAGTALMLHNGQSLIGTFNLGEIVVGIVYGVIGAFLVSRVRDNWIGWLFLTFALLWSTDLVLAQVQLFGASALSGSVPGTELAGWAATWIWIPGTAVVLFGLPLLFPDGRLPSRRWRPVLVLGIAIVALDVVGHATATWPIRAEFEKLANFDATTAPGLPGLMAAIGDPLVFFLLPVPGILALVIRYRSSRGLVRQQMRWFTLAVLIFFLLFLGDLFVSFAATADSGLLSAVGLAWLPIALAVAILRYRLYEIDRIISRTASWAVVSAILAGVFVAGLVALEGLLAGVTQGRTLAVAGSTLTAFALFQPIRRRVQRTVDRRFNRTRYDAQRTAVAFGARLRDEVDLDAVASELCLAAGRTVAPTSATVWLRSSVSSVSSNSLIS